MRPKKDTVITEGDLVRWCWQRTTTEIGVVIHACPSGLRATVCWMDGQVATYSYAVRLLKVVS